MFPFIETVLESLFLVIPFSSFIASNLLPEDLFSLENKESHNERFCVSVVKPLFDIGMYDKQGARSCEYVAVGQNSDQGWIDSSIVAEK